MPISADSILLDVLSEHPQTLNIIRTYEKSSSICICCTYLFATLAEIAGHCGIDQAELLERLNRSLPERD